ncbi:hypothetical protein OEZ85_011181 [Tetradesmus obliquus]|uniref:Uncharacterized protein n=1 Tax=Tetradesmus obliquus TaxID=3088 RepID=A0ABY8TU62_TETOB|nr:hypothetical protein OEZ85_011181 [Tetradesmus obliquus]
MRHLSLALTFKPPKQLLRGLFADGRNLTMLWLEDEDGVKTLPPLPARLQFLNVRLSLVLEFDPPEKLLQGLFADARNLTTLCVSGQHITTLPQLPAHLQDLRLSDCKQLRSLHVSGCRNLRSLPELPATLEELYCNGCAALTALPSSLGSTALRELNCSGCARLQQLPALPESLKNLEAEDCTSLTQVSTAAT